MGNILTRLWPAPPKDPKTKQDTKNTTQPQPDPDKPDHSKEIQAAMNAPTRRWVE